MARRVADQRDADVSELVRSAGVIGIATMTSRVLGLVRDQVLAYFFGAGDAMDAFRIAFRLPNVLRDLFAEGALSAALVPTFTRALATGDRAAAWRLASNVITVLLLISGAVVVAGIVFAEPLVRLYAGGFRDVPGKIELTIRLTRIMFPFLAMVATAAVHDGDAQRAASLLHPGALAGDVQRRHHRLRGHLRAAVAAPGHRAHRRDRRRHAASAASGQILLQWPALRREGFRYRPVLDVRDPWLREIGRLMVPGRGRARGGADQSARQQLARGRAGNRRGVVARLRVPPDVHADRPVRHLDRDGVAADDLRARGATATIPASGARCRAVCA